MIFPTLSLLHTIQNELLEKYNGIGGFHFLLFEGFIKEIRQYFDLNQSVPSTILRELLINEVFEQLRIQGKIEYLAQVPFGPGYRQAILAGIDEWQRSGLSPAVFSQWAINHGPKEEQLVLIYKAYQALLLQSGYTDDYLTLKELQQSNSRAEKLRERSQIIFVRFYRFNAVAEGISRYFGRLV